MQILSTISAGTLPGMFTEGGVKWAMGKNLTKQIYKLLNGDMF